MQRGVPEDGRRSAGDRPAHRFQPLSSTAMEDVWTWGSKVGGNLWRTTGDIQDNWNSMSDIGFDQIKIADYVNPGHWNDPDMLEIGNGGMTDDEYRVHMTLWSLLSAPLLAGNDLAQMSEATKSILMNKEVIAIDQDSAVNHPKVKQLSRRQRDLDPGTGGRINRRWPYLTGRTRRSP